MDPEQRPPNEGTEPLFPVAAPHLQEDGDEDEEEKALSSSSRATLFPSFAAFSFPSSDEVKSSTAPAFDWLQNASFNQPLESTEKKDQQPVEVPDVIDIVSEDEKDEKETDESRRERRKRLREEEKPRHRETDSRSHRHHRDHRLERHRSERREKEKEGRREDRHRVVSKSQPVSIGKPAVSGTSSKKVFLEETGLSAEQAFRVDTKPDGNNLAFNSLYNLHVPRYYENRCIQIHRQEGDEFESERKKRKVVRYFKGVKISQEIIDYSKPSSSHESNASFIPIAKSLDACVGIAGSSGIYDAATSLYVQGKGMPLEKSDETVDIEFSSMSSKREFEGIKPTKPSQQQILFNRTQQFNESLRKDPHNVENWLKFIDFQDEIFDHSTEKVVDKSTGLLEKKLSIIDKAIEKNAKNTTLHMKRLEVARNLWEPDVVNNEWKKLVFLYPNIPFLWKSYINFVKTHITYFSVSKVIKIYTKCFSIMNKMLEGDFQTHKAPENIESQMLTIFSDYCGFLHDCGLTERCFASWQAMVEFNFFAPKMCTFDMPLTDWLTFFEPFWDSGVPRFGEEKAQGWALVMENKSLLPVTESLDAVNQLENDIIERKESKSETWVKLENLRECHQWLPVRDSGLENLEDCDRNVLVDDISSALFRLKTSEAKFELIVSFLTFLGAVDEKVSPSIAVDDENQQWTQIDLNLLPMALSLDGKSVFVNNVFQEAIKICPPEHRSLLTQNWIKFHVKNVDNNPVSVKSAKRLIKSVLKEESNRNNLVLWEIYAKFEGLFGDKSETRRIYETAIKMFLKTVDKKQLLSFVRSFAELILGFDEVDKMSPVFKHNCDKELDALVTKTIVSAVLGEEVQGMTPSLVLKTKKCLKQLIDQNSVDALACYSLFVYLTQGVKPASAAFEEYLASAEIQSQETVFESYLQILIMHLQRNFGSLKVLQEVLERALDAFPFSPKFLSLFVNLETGSFVVGKIRRFFSRPAKSGIKSSAIRWIFAIQSEMKRLISLRRNLSEVPAIGDANVYESGTVWRVRALFERATCFPHISQNVSFWRMYVMFEMKEGDSKRAKALFYRALQCCPWSKTLYKDGVNHFPETLQEMVDIITEKEIRIRTPIEEIELLLQNADDVGEESKWPAEARVPEDGGGGGAEGGGEAAETVNKASHQ